MKLISFYCLFFLFQILTCDFAHAQTVVNLEATQDSYVNSSATTTNYGSDTIIMASTTMRRLSQYYQRSFVEFEISSIPSNAVIVSANIVLKRSTSITGINPFVVRRITSTWDQNSITFSSQPTIASTTDAKDYSATYTLSNDSVFFDVTAMTQNMLYGVIANQGWSIQVSNEALTSASGCSFYSMESAFIPYLQIEYYLPLQVTSCLIDHESSIGEKDGVIEPVISGGTSGFNYVWTEGSTGDTLGTNLILSGLPYGWYALNVKGSYGEEMNMAFLVGVDSDTVSIVFAPGPELVEDAFFYNKDAATSATNYGSYSVWLASDGTYGGVWAQARSVAKFDLWADENLDYQSAELKLTGSTNSPTYRDNSARFRKILSDWDEYVITYNHQPSYSTGDSIHIREMTSPTEIKYVELSPFWEEWKLDNSTNYGMLFELDLYNNTYAKQQYYSSDYSGGASRPMITFVIYTHNLFRRNPIYAKLYRELSGGLYRAYHNVLYFHYDEEYESPSTNLNYAIYHYSDMVTPVVDGSTLPLPLVYGRKEHQLNLSSASLTPGQVYILVVTNDKDEKFYLRFKK